MEPDLQKSTDRPGTDQKARDGIAMLAITIVSGGIIALVLYFVGAFSRSTG